jgi:hypothetical protein
MPLDPAIRSLIGQFRNSPQWNEFLDLELLQKFMPSLVGDQLAGVMRVSAIHGARLVVDVPDKTWRRQLFLMKPKLLERINELWGAQRLTEIDFRV